MMYDVSLKKIQIFPCPYNEGKIYHQLLKGNNKSVRTAPSLDYIMKFVATRLHPDFVSIYEGIMVNQVCGYQDYDVVMTEGRGGIWYLRPNL